MHGQREAQVYNGVRGGDALPEAEKLLPFGRSMESANLPTFRKFVNVENHRYLCCLTKGANAPSCTPHPRNTSLSQGG